MNMLGSKNKEEFKAFYYEVFGKIKDTIYERKDENTDIIFVVDEIPLYQPIGDKIPECWNSTSCAIMYNEKLVELVDFSKLGDSRKNINIFMAFNPLQITHHASEPHEPGMVQQAWNMAVSALALVAKLLLAFTILFLVNPVKTKAATILG